MNKNIDQIDNSFDLKKLNGSIILAKEEALEFEI